MRGDMVCDIRNAAVTFMPPMRLKSLVIFPMSNTLRSSPASLISFLKPTVQRMSEHTKRRHAANVHACVCVHIPSLMRVAAFTDSQSDILQ